MRPEDQPFAAKWSADIARLGFTALPNLLLIHRTNLKITPSEMVVLLGIESFRWNKQNPYPGLDTLRMRVHLSNHSITRCITNLEEKGLIKRIRRAGTSNAYSLEPLIDVLNKAAKYYLTPGKPIPKSLRNTVIYHRTKMFSKKDPLKEDASPRHARTSQPP